jgi:hypothetical protein
VGAPPVRGEERQGRVTEIPESIHPQRIYTAEVVAHYAGLDRDTVYSIPEKHLPKRRLGPRRGRVGYLGADLLRYLGAA